MLISFFSIIINFFIPISNIITILIIIGGSLIYLFNFFKIKSKKKETVFLIIVLLFSLFFSFYAGVNDDFPYHYETIKNFKNFNIFEITHHRMISYNSNWLFLNSIFSIEYFTSTIFILTSLIYSILIYDSYYTSTHSLKNKVFFTGFISYFVFIFSLGVINKYKDFGTDIPGVIISFYVLIIITYYLFDKELKNYNKLLIVVLPLIIFAFIIKITNSLIFLLLVLFIFKLDLKKLNYKYVVFYILFFHFYGSFKTLLSVVV